MKILVIGANGKAGREITAEAVRRGHEVTAVVRTDNKSAAQNVLQKDLFDLTYEDLKGFPVIVDAFGTWNPDTLDVHQTSLRHLADLLSDRDNRLLVVGGAGSLYVDPERKHRLSQTPDFPDIFKPLANHMMQALDDLKPRKDVQWTYLSPAALFEADAPRSGAYTSGDDHLLVNSKGESKISYADYAIAMVDEIENAKHLQEQFTVVAEY